VQVLAKNKSKTEDRLSVAKFNREYELTEKIECMSLNGHFYPGTGRLVVDALAKNATVSNEVRIPEMISNICRGCIGWTSADAAAANGDNVDGDCGGDDAGSNGYDAVAN